MTKPVIHHGWLVLAACCLCMTVSSSVWYTFSVFYATIVDQLKWSRAETALAFSAMVIMGGLMDPLVGRIVDRVGSRLLFSIGGVLLAAGFMAASRIDSPVGLYLVYGLLLAAGKSAAGMVPIGTLLQSWFRRRLGTATGLVAASVAVGMLSVLLAERLISGLGWRQAYMVLGVAFLVILPLPAWFIVRQRPQDMGLLPDGEYEAAAGSKPTTLLEGVSTQHRVIDTAWTKRDWTPGQALKTRRFWFLFLGMLAGVLSHQLVLVHQVAYIGDLGYGIAIGSFVYFLMGISSGFAKFGWGWLSDRIGREMAYSLAVIFLLGGVGALLSGGIGFWVLCIYSLLFGVGYAAGAPLYPAISADLFQGPRFGSIYGLANVAIGLGAAGGAWFGGFVFDTTGAYWVAFALSAAMVVVSAGCFWVAGPRQVRAVAGVKRTQNG
jgi:MFS family permease